MGRSLLALLFGISVSAAGEPDGAVAEAARWVEPRGCASGSFRSRALPVVTEIEEAWRLELPRIAAPPVHWDGKGYVVGRTGARAVLVAFDLASGRELARVKLKGYHEGAGLLVWDHMVFVQPGPDQITGYRIERGKLEPVWIFRGRKYEDGWRHPRRPVVHDNEIYCFLGRRLARLRPGSKFPAWVLEDDVDPDLAGRPAVFGPYVFVATMSADTITADAPDNPRLHKKELANLYLHVHRRSDGKAAGFLRVCQAVHDPDRKPALQLTVAGETVHIGSRWKLLSTAGFATHVMVPLQLKGDGVALDDRVGLWSYEVPPAHHPRGTVVLAVRDDDLQWMRYRERKFFRLTSRSLQPDLFADRVPPTVLGDIVYFGSWAMDVETREILWRLPFGEVSYPVVPADGLFLVVEGRRVLRAFKGRGKK
ncbi:MAG: outer membrane protein assembly factor BamB family protein [Planctomycetota bacterium]|jgi:hypothetical protein